jgi:C-terminal processing protease CtpA/Prc
MLRKIHFMRVPILIGFAITLLCSFHSKAQLSEEQKTEAIQIIAKSIAGNYVDANMGGQISSYILTANYKGAFKKAGTWQEFDEMVTKSLQQFSDDRHIYVKNDASVVKELRSPQSEKKEEMNTQGDKTSADNYGIQESKVIEGNTGYIKLSKIDISKESLPVLYEAMRKVENTDKLIIDLRDNKGGGSEIGAVLESYFLPAGTPTLEFTSRAGTLTTEKTVDWLTEKKYDKPVYIIINKNTGSAAEAFAFVMQKNKRATIVGETSSGAASRNEWFVVNDENYLSISTETTHLAGTNATWEKTGVKPDIKLKSGDPLEAIMKK